MDIKTTPTNMWHCDDGETANYHLMPSPRARQAWWACTEREQTPEAWWAAFYFQQRDASLTKRSSAWVLLYFTGTDIKIVDFAKREESDISTTDHEQLFVCSQIVTQLNLFPSVDKQHNSEMMQLCWDPTFLGNG